jgi:hypothetical protein
MYKTKIVTKPENGVSQIADMVREINDSGDRIVSFNIQHESPGRARSFIFILETPDSAGRFLGE